MDAHSPSCNIHTLVFMIGVMQVLLDQVFTTPKSHRRELQPHPIFMSWNLSKLVSNVSTKNKKTQKKQGHHGVRSSFPSSKSLHTHTHTHKQTYRHPACASPATPVFPPVMRTVLPLMELGFGSNLNKDRVLTKESMLLDRKTGCFATLARGLLPTSSYFPFQWITISLSLSLSVYSRIKSPNKHEVAIYYCTITFTTQNSIKTNTT